MSSSIWAADFSARLVEVDDDRRAGPGQLDKGPFYAVKVQMGDLGTYAGLAVSTDSEVLDETGAGIPGLYAVGTAAVSVFGGGYPGYGANIGPAMVFGYHVGKQLAEQAAAGRESTLLRS